MTKNEIQAWLNSPNGFALRVESDELKGLLRSKLTIPQNVCALIVSTSGRSEVLVSGEEQRGEFSALLVKTVQVELSFTFDDLPSKNDLPVAVTCKLAFTVVPKKSDLELFKENALEKKTSLSLEDLRLLLHEYVKRGVYDYILSQTAEEIYRYDHRPHLEVALDSALKKVMFDCGLDFKGVKDLTLRCEAYENLIVQRARAKAAQEEEAIKAELAEAEIRAVETRKRRELAEELAERDIEHERILKMQQLRAEEQKQQAESAKTQQLTQQQMQHELERAELQQRIESDNIKAEAKAERVRQLNKIFKEADLKTLVEEIKDEKVRAKLYALLIKKEMSPAQLEAMKLSDELTEKIDEAIDRLFQIARLLPSGCPELAHSKVRNVAEHYQDTTSAQRLFGEQDSLETSSRIFVAADKRILCFDLNTAATTPLETHFFENGQLGYLRSVRFERSSGVLLAGAQGGVYMRHLSSGLPSREFTFPYNNGVRTGVNSAVCYGDSLFATHSEYGLVRWYINEPSKCEKLFPHLTPAESSTRGVTITDNWLFFSNGPNIYRASLNDLSLVPVAYQCHRWGKLHNNTLSVTAFLVTSDFVFAGNNKGQVLRWRRDDQTSPTVMIEGNGEPVYSLKMITLDGAHYLLVGRKEKDVLAIRFDGTHEVFFNAPAPIRWVEGVGNFVCGVDRTEHNIYVWRSNDPNLVAFTIPSHDRIHDVISV